MNTFICVPDMQFEPRTGALTKHCKVKNMSEISIPLTRLQKLVFSDKAKLMICALPSSGYKTFFHRLISLVEGRIILTNNSKDIYHKITVGSGDSYQAAKRGAYIRMSKRLENYTKVLFHRHPFDRLVDIYVSQEGFSRLTLNNTSDALAPLMSYVRLLKYDKNYPYRKMSFNKFIKYVIHSARISLHPWRSLYDTCMPCVYGYDTIIGWENRHIETMRLVEKLGISWPSHGMPLSGSDRLWQNYYMSVDTKDIKILLNMYERDMQMFSYTWPP